MSLPSSLGPPGMRIVGIEIQQLVTAAAACKFLAAVLQSGLHSSQRFLEGLSFVLSLLKVRRGQPSRNGPHAYVTSCNTRRMFSQSRSTLLLAALVPLRMSRMSSTAYSCLPDTSFCRLCRQADKLYPMQAPPLMTLTAAELIQGMCYAAKVTGVDTPENYNSVIASFPSKVKAAAIGFVRSRLNMPRAKDTDYIDNLCSKLAVTCPPPILSLACCW